MKWHRPVGLAFGLALAVGTVAGAAAQTGTIRGRVIDTGTQEGMAGAQILIVGTQRGSVASQDGVYEVSSVPVGEHELRVSFIGYRTATSTVTVAAGETAVSNFEMEQSVIDLEEVVVTGVVGEVARGRVPFTVDRLSVAQMPVTIAGNPASMLTGKVAGASIVGSSGRPGMAPSVQLRGPTSISLQGRSQDPLYIVDGVILSESVLDFDGLDIESIEIIKGAAAASLYGARAANGVIQITTQRGRNVADNDVRYTVRTEIGKSNLPGRFDLTQKHHFAMTEDGSQFLSSDGEACDWLECDNVALAGQRRQADESASLWNTVQRESWPGVTYDHVDRFFNPGLHMTNSVSVAGRSGGTNYRISYNRLHEDGVMEGHGGEVRHTIRLNMDQSIRDDITVSATMSYMRNKFDERNGPIFQLTRMPAGVDIATPDPDFPDFFVLKPDPNNDNENPLNLIRRNTNTVTNRNRFLGSIATTWSPLSWLDIDGQFAFDRLDRNFNTYEPKDWRNLNGGRRTGSIQLNHRRVEGINTAVTAKAEHRIGDLGVTTSVRYLYEREDDKRVEAESEEFVADGIFSIQNTPEERRDGESSFTPERRDGFFVNTILDFKDRYMLDALVRQDGNSRFGPDARRSWYFRVGGSYTLSDEPWFNVPGVDNVSLRYAIGTAGSAPNFDGQFETFEIGSGVITPGALGNRNLKPEVTTEQEMGIDAILGRFSFDVTFARSRTEDALLQVPLLAYRGFSTQWQNAAALKSNTIEATLTAQIVRTRDFAWTTRVLFDRTRQQVTALTVPPFTQGVGGQGFGDIFLVREGEALGTFYGFQFAENCGHLPSGIDCSQFQVNNDGLMVWVGDAGSWENGWQTYTDAEGNARNWWGTPAPFTVRGQEILWGQPFQAEADDPISGERTTFLPIGKTTPDYSLGWSNTMTWKGFTAYALVRSVQGFDVWNQPLQWATFQDYSGIMDQSGMPEADQKPIGYYSTLYNASGLVPNSVFIQDASFIKLQEVRLAYQAGRDVLDRLPFGGGVEGLTLSVAGHNLWTSTDYNGYDPDIGATGGGVGSATIARVDGFGYPPFRTFTLGVELNF
ncbi:MAG: SusC/RagA family TonB-linked outer membrane protein [Longimicrobiales bacterium]